MHSRGGGFWIRFQGVARQLPATRKNLVWVGNLDDTHTSIDTLVGASQSASGALQVAQAGNQLLALQSQQLADLTAAVAAQGRAQALDAARDAAIEAEARERFRRFRGKN